MGGEDKIEPGDTGLGGEMFSGLCLGAVDGVCQWAEGRLDAGSGRLLAWAEALGGAWLGLGRAGGSKGVESSSPTTNAPSGGQSLATTRASPAVK